MLRKTLRYFTITAGFIVLMGLTQISMASASNGKAVSPSSQQTKSLQDKVRHSLLMLPYYGVFDEISFDINGDTVTLTGEVRRPLLTSEAEDAVRKVDGVTKVVNNIEILPLSTADDSLRWRMYRAIYSQSGFERYAIQAVKPIRIIVKNGNVTLVGVVGSQLDKTLAGTAARNVPFAFSVTNDLTIG